MAASKRFHIPSLNEMEEADVGKFKDVEPAFKRHKEASHTTEEPSSKGASARTVLTQDTKIQEKSEEERVSTSAAPSKSSVIKKVSDNHTVVDTAQVADDENALKGSVTANKIGSSNCLIVNARQRGNPILKSVRNVPWEYGNIVPDYVMGQSNCALFLSLRYHQLHPNYIHDRLKQLGHSYDLRVILVQIDVKEPHQILKELAKICILADCTLILAFSPEEAGRYLETYKVFENKPPEAIMEKTEDNFMAKFTDCLTRVKSVNKTDCSTLLTAFGSLANVIDAKEEDLSLCPGFGPQKARRLHSLIHEPFLRNLSSSTSSRKDVGSSLLNQASSSASS